MPSKKIQKRGRTSLVTDIVYAYIGAAAIAGDTAVRALSTLKTTGVQARRDLGVRLEDLAEDLGDTVEEVVPEAVLEPAKDLVHEVQRTYRTRSKKARSTLKTYRGKLTRRGEAALEVAGETLGTVSRRLATGLDPVFHAVGLATRSDFGRLDAKLDQLATQLESIEKGR